LELRREEGEDVVEEVGGGEDAISLEAEEEEVVEVGAVVEGEEETMSRPASNIMNR
jgi:hypothetical protein